jgi:hypothetical protein
MLYIEKGDIHAYTVEHLVVSSDIIMCIFVTSK